MHHKLYIMFAGDFIKIGVTTREVKVRARQIQTGCPLAITDIFYTKLPDKSTMLRVEKMLHDRFKKYNTYGEWFTKFYHPVASVSKEMDRTVDDFIHTTFSNQDIVGKTKSEIGIDRIRRKETKKMEETKKMDARLKKFKQNNPHVFNEQY